MNKVKFFITTLFVASLGVMTAPLFSEEYPKQEIVERQESQGFQFYSLKNKTKDTVLVYANHDPKVDRSLEVFFTYLQMNYQAKFFSPEDLEKISNAAMFAALKHMNQTSKDGTPYIHHPITVANNLMSVGNIMDVDVIVAGLLHDTMQVTDTSYEEIKTKFGDQVAIYVQEVTVDPALTPAQVKAEEIQTASSKSKGAAQIKMAEKLDHLATIVQDSQNISDTSKKEYFIWSNEMTGALPQDASPALEQEIYNLSKDFLDNQ